VLIQVCIWIAGAIILAIGVGLVHTGHEVGNPIAAVGSVIVLAAMLVFGWLVFRSQRDPTSERGTIMPHRVTAIISLRAVRAPKNCPSGHGRTTITMCSMVSNTSGAGGHQVNPRQGREELVVMGLRHVKAGQAGRDYCYSRSERGVPKRKGGAYVENRNRGRQSDA
jgi:hypothetical protein